MIEGVQITPLKKITDSRGSVMHMLRNDSPIFKKFGEIYFSTILYDSVKAWRLHLKSTSNYACITGKVKLVLFDHRKNSNSKGQCQELILGQENYFLVTIPKNIWKGFKGLQKGESIIANCSTLPYKQDEIIRTPQDHSEIPYKW